MFNCLKRLFITKPITQVFIVEKIHNDTYWKRCHRGVYSNKESAIKYSKSIEGNARVTVMNVYE